MDKKFADFKKSLERIYNSKSLYRKKMDEAKVTLDDIKSFEDISILPITEKKDFFVDYPYGYYAVDFQDIKVYHASSGTTGKLLVVGLSENDLKYRINVLKRNMSMAGIKKDDVFIPKKYKARGSAHRLYKIDKINKDGSLLLRGERAQEDE